MSDAFVGRQPELAQLSAMLQRVVSRDAGVFVSIRGRRQVGKSRLAEEFARRADVPSAFFAASRGADPALERQRFIDVVAESSLEASSTFEAVHGRDWMSLLRVLAAQTTRPSMLILDELPYLLAGDAQLEGVLQTVWDRHLSRVPLLLVTLGSHVSTMERLASYGNPMFGRVREMRLDPLTVADVAGATGLPASDAFDAMLITGGYPRIVQEWDADTTVTQFIEHQLSDSTSPLVVVGERIVTAEFPPAYQPGAVLRTIGAGERTFSGIAQRLDINHGSLARALRLLSDETRVITAMRPLSRRRSNDTRYLVSDPYLRFWLRFVQPRMELLFRGRADVAVRETLADWTTYRGTAIEPLVRSSIERMLPHQTLGPTQFVGGYWDRNGDVKVDLVGAERDHAPADVTMLGSIKWRARRRFGRDDVLALAATRSQVPGAQTAPLVGVSRAGFDTDALDVALTPDDLIAAWR